MLLLFGGGVKQSEHDLEYYYDNMPLYQQCVREAFAPYRNSLDAISSEIKAIGGTGIVHGCIVDIDWNNHIYLNPFDGTITPYFAWDMTRKIVFGSVSALLKESPYPPIASDGTPLIESYESSIGNGTLPILASDNKGDTVLATVPELVLDRSMYEPSRIMRSIQYVFDQGVVRIWNDAVLDMGSRTSAEEASHQKLIG